MKKEQHITQLQINTFFQLASHTHHLHNHTLYYLLYKPKDIQKYPSKMRLDV